MLDIHVSDGGNLTIQQFNKIHTCLKKQWLWKFMEKSYSKDRLYPIYYAMLNSFTLFR